MKYKLLENSYIGQKPIKGEHYTIVGAGISGLLLAYYFKKKRAVFSHHRKI